MTYINNTYDIDAAIRDLEIWNSDYKPEFTFVFQHTGKSLCGYLMSDRYGRRRFITADGDMNINDVRRCLYNFLYEENRATA